MNFWNISDLDTFNHNVVVKNKKMRLESFNGMREILKKKHENICGSNTKLVFFSVYESNAGGIDI